MSIASQVKVLREVQQRWGNNVDCQSLIDRLIGKLHKCPQCKGAGVVYEKYNAYPSNLPDSGWAEDWKYREKTCNLCKGEGYTEHEYKPRMVQDGWI